MKQDPKVWESKALVRFPDCDPYNHLNNARYIDYFINAREDHIMANIHMNIYEFAAQNALGWVVTKNQIVYLRPALLMETVVIDSTILRLGEKDLQVEMRMWDEKKHSLKSVLWVNFVHINMKTNRPHSHTKEMMDIFSPFENPLPRIMSFDERVDDLRRK